MILVFKANNNCYSKEISKSRNIYHSHLWSTQASSNTQDFEFSYRNIICIVVLYIYKNIQYCLTLCYQSRYFILFQNARMCSICVKVQFFYILIVLELGNYRRETYTHVICGSQTRLWEDTWVGNHPFKDLYPTLQNITNLPHDTVANIMRSTPLNISFWRALVRDKLDEWEDLIAKITHIYLFN